MTDRRTFIAGSVVIFVVSLVARAWPAEKVYRIGYLSSLSASGGLFQLEALRQGLRDFGYVEGRNIVIDVRWAEGNYDSLPP